MTRDESTDSRTRELGRWLDATEKVISRTLTDAPWENSRIARDLAAEVKALREAPGRDVLVQNSAGVIAELLRLDLIDDLRIALVPVLVGGGLRLFPNGVAASFETAAVTARHTAQSDCTSGVPDRLPGHRQASGEGRRAGPADVDEHVSVDCGSGSRRGVTLVSVTTAVDALAVLRTSARSGVLAQLCSAHGVTVLVAFGSAVDAERGHAARDLDLAVRTDPAAFQPLGFLDDVARLVGFDAVDLMDLRRAGPVARTEALVFGEVLYEEVPAQAARLQAAAITEQMETQWLRDLALRRMAER